MPWGTPPSTLGTTPSILRTTPSTLGNTRSTLGTTLSTLVVVARVLGVTLKHPEPLPPSLWCRNGQNLAVLGALWGVTLGRMFRARDTL